MPHCDENLVNPTSIREFMKRLRVDHAETFDVDKQLALPAPESLILLAERQATDQAQWYRFEQPNTATGHIVNQNARACPKPQNRKAGIRTLTLLP